MEKEGNNLFQVNLKGMIALLSEHIYSNPNTFVRELLQNCVDAITALRNIDENYKGRIDVFLNEDKTVVFRDNGIGLKEEEVYRFLTVIGESSKRDTPDADDFIGRFGIGLLSCFVVTNEITVESRSAMGGQPVCWCGKVDGTYQLTLSDEERPIGSQVVLHPKGDWMHLFEYETFKKILVGYGEVLPYPIYLHYQGEEELVNTPSPVWLDPKATRKELLDYGAKVFQSSALDAFRIYTESGKVEGVLYVLPFRTQFSVRNSHKVYLKRMLLSEDDCNLLPSWAFFIRCLVNADGLLSTASRESLVSNDQLKDARKEIGVAIKDYLRGLVQNDRATFHVLIFIIIQVDQCQFIRTVGFTIKHALFQPFNRLRHIQPFLLLIVISQEIGGRPHTGMPSLFPKFKAQFFRFIQFRVTEIKRSQIFKTIKIGNYFQGFFVVSSFLCHVTFRSVERIS